MAEAMVSSGTLFSDLDFLLAELEKISALKKLLESAYTGKEPSLKLIISGISKQVIVVLGLLRKIESEFQHNVEMRTPLKELQDTEEKEQKEAQCFLEVLSSHSAWESCVFAETKKHGEVHLVKRKKTTKAPEIQGFRRELDTMVPEDLKEVPVVFAETKKHGEVHLVKRKKTTKAPEIQGFRRELDTMVPEDLKEVPVVFAETKKHGEVHLVKRKKTTKAPEIQGFRRELDTMVPEDLKEVPVGFAETKQHDERHLVIGKKPTKASQIPGFRRKMLALTPDDLKEVPVYLAKVHAVLKRGYESPLIKQNASAQYMKGHITCDQINVVINNLNRAMMAKYKVRNQAVGSMSTTDKTLYYKYLEQENKDTEGCYFIVEDDIKLFTGVKMDKRFRQILIILRHCRKLREIRSSGVIRYVIC